MMMKPSQNKNQKAISNTPKELVAEAWRILFTDTKLLLPGEPGRNGDQMFYLQTTSTLVKLSTGEKFIQCEICGRCYQVEAWNTAKEKITRIGYGYSCSHKDTDPGIIP